MNAIKNYVQSYLIVKFVFLNVKNHTVIVGCHVDDRVKVQIVPKVVPKMAFSSTESMCGYEHCRGVPSDPGLRHLSMPLEISMILTTCI